MENEYVGALDVGTSSIRFFIFDSRGARVHGHQMLHSSERPNPGWVEQDPLMLWRHSKKCIDECMREALEKFSIEPASIKAIGIANQRETTIVWDRTSGQPLYNAIVWNDSRTRELTTQMKKEHDSEEVREISGLPISSYFSGVKLRWMLENLDNVRDAVEAGTAMFGTVDTWLVWKLSKEKAYVTDVTNAGRTMMMNLKKLDWDDKLMNIIGIDRSILPKIRSCSEVFGEMADTTLEGVKITGLVGDQQAALVGQCCFEVGEAKCTYGTGCFLIVNTGEEPMINNSGLLATPAYRIGRDGPRTYSLEGSIADAGSVVDWLRDKMNIIDETSELEQLAASVQDTADLVFVPAFSGLFSPLWREDARGIIVGISSIASRAHFARAALAGITHQVNDVLLAASKVMGASLATLRVDGGVSKSNLCLQLQADNTGLEVLRPKNVETTALGAAFCAGHAVGLYPSIDQFKDSWQLDKQFSPKIDHDARAAQTAKWEAAIECSLKWAEGPPTAANETRVTAEEPPSTTEKTPSAVEASPNEEASTTADEGFKATEGARATAKEAPTAAAKSAESAWIPSTETIAVGIASACIASFATMMALAERKK